MDVELFEKQSVVDTVRCRAVVCAKTNALLVARGRSSSNMGTAAPRPEHRELLIDIFKRSTFLYFDSPESILERAFLRFLLAAVSNQRRRGSRSGLRRERTLTVKFNLFNVCF